jgi:hypothetical protein
LRCTDICLPRLPPARWARVSMETSILYLRIALVSGLVTLMSFTQPSKTTDTLACVEVKSTPINYLRRAMVDVELTNHCSDDITGYVVGLSDRYGTEPVATSEGCDLLPALAMRPARQPDPYNPTDILRRGKALRLRLAVSPNTPKYMGEASVLALVFLDGTAVGDSGAIQSLLQMRKEYLEGLVSIKRQLETFGEVMADRERFRDRVKESKDMRDRTEMSFNERRVSDWMDNIVSYSEVAPSNESWVAFVEAEVKELDRKIQIYKEHCTLDGAR